jgi:hypothetical protein
MIEEYAASAHAALLRDLSEVEVPLYSTFNGKREQRGTRNRRPYADELEIYSFPQQWSSTALGFGGVGGQAFTTATTVVVVCRDEACVYFGGRFAYKVVGWRRSEVFQGDLGRHAMADVMESSSRYEAKKKEVRE